MHSHLIKYSRFFTTEIVLFVYYCSVITKKNRMTEEILCIANSYRQIVYHKKNFILNIEFPLYCIGNRNGYKIKLFHSREKLNRGQIHWIFRTCRCMDQFEEEKKANRMYFRQFESFSFFMILSLALFLFPNRPSEMIRLGNNLYSGHINVITIWNYSELCYF